VNAIKILKKRNTEAKLIKKQNDKTLNTVQSAADQHEVVCRQLL
jgi:hypothetical protein